MNLVDDWLTLPDIADATDVGISKVRRWVEDRAIAGIKHGSPSVFQVPALFLKEDAPVPHLRGTLVLLADAGFDDDEAIVWLFTPDDSLPGRPIDLLREGNKGEVRRRAQALAF
nr:Rv2175c family DNA-binding protein [Brevibacterium daeguense]